MSMEEYLDTLTEQIRCRRARGAVREEVRSHLEDQAEAFREQGFDEKTARERAVQEMGDPVAVGGKLNRIHRPKMAWGSAAAAGVLGAAGLLLQYFLQRAFPDALFAEVDFGRQFCYLGLSLAVMMVICYLDYVWIGRHARQIYLVLALLLLAGGIWNSIPVNGAFRWVSMPFGLYMNLTTAVLLEVPLYGAVLYSWRGQGYMALAKAFLWMLPAILPAMAVYSVYTVVLLFLAFVAVLAAAVWKGWFGFPAKRGLALVLGGGVLIPAAGLWCAGHFGTGYAAERLKLSVLTVLGPAESASYLTGMQRKILENSRWVGAAYGQPQEWMSNVSDYTLTYTIGHYGILAGLLVAGLLALLFIRLFCRTFHQKNQMGMLMGVGCSVVFCIQFVLYVAENLTLIRPCGSYCPFLSYGGNGMLATYALCGLMLSIYRYEDVFPERQNAGTREKCG